MRLSALLLASLAVVAPAAGAKEPALTRATAVLAVVGGEAGRAQLVWLNPATLRQLKRGAVKLGDAAATVLSPNAGKVAVGSSASGVRIVDVRRMKLLPGAIAKRSGWDVSPYAWPSSRRLFAFEWSNRGGSRLLVIDPVSRRVVTRVAVDGYSTWASAGAGIVGIGRLGEGIGPASVLVVDRDGATRTVVLDRVFAGGEESGTEGEPDYRVASPGLAVDPDGRTGYVMGNSALLAEIDLVTLAVTYRELRTLRSVASRAKVVTGWARQATWLGEGTIAVAGSEYDRLRRDPSGVELVDVRAGTMRPLAPRGGFVLSASGLLLAGGAASQGDGTWTGMGLAAYTIGGEKLWQVLDGEPVSWVQAVGGYAYVIGQEAYPPTVRVIDLADGNVRTLRGQMPFLVTR